MPRSVDELIDEGVIGDATREALTHHFTRPQLMDLVFSIGHYVMTSWALSTFGVEIEGGADPSGRVPGQGMEARRGRGVDRNARLLTVDVARPVG